MTVLLVSLASSGPAAGQRPWELSAKQREHLLAVKADASLRPGVPLTLDFSDNNHFRFLRRQLREAKILNDGHGHDLAAASAELQITHRHERPRQDLTLLQREPEYGVYQPGAFITQLSPVEKGKYYAAANTAIPGAVELILLLQLFDSWTFEPIGRLSVVEEWLDNQVSISATGRSRSGEVTAVFTYLYHTREDPIPVAQVQFKSIGGISDQAKSSIPTKAEFGGLEPCACADDSATDPDDPDLCATKDSCCTSGNVGNACENDKRAKICLKRDNTSVEGDCAQDIGQGDQTNRYLDIAGTVTLDDNLVASWDDCLPEVSGQDCDCCNGSDTDTCCLTVYIANDDGMCEVETSTVTKDDFTGTASSPNVEWNWEDINFNDSCLDSSGKSEFYMRFAVKTGDGNAPTITTTTIYSDQCAVSDGDSLNPVACVFPLQFVWGCLAAGTPILMADGSFKNVEEILVGEKVVADVAGRQLTVVNTYRGKEKAPLVVIEDDRGNRLAMTSTHPTVTARGILLAKQLKVGDVLTTENGPAAIITIERPEHDGEIEVYNLDLGGEGEAVTDDTTLFAGGILVGDNQMQGRYERLFRTAAQDEIRPMWRRDYAQWVERQSRNGRQ